MLQEPTEIISIPDNCTSAHSLLSWIAAYQVCLIVACNADLDAPDRIKTFMDNHNELVTLMNEAIAEVVKANYHAANPAIHIKDNMVTVPPSASNEAQLLDFAHCLLSKTEPLSSDYFIAAVFVCQMNEYAADVDHWNVRHE